MSGEPSPGRARAQQAAPLSYALGSAARAHHRRMLQLLGEIGLVPGQELLVVELASTPGVTQAELVVRLRVEQPTIAKMLGRLERAGIVRRAPDSGDARRFRLYLAGDGDALAGAVVQQWEAMDRELGQALSAAEREQLRLLLGKVKDRFETDTEAVAPN
ncbi:MAG TPA: MarR family winged helix-turn-helix transcriptional regulator [Actinomycetota bacterium]|jgi:MarR family transcriptional regulator, organic hydroperoxide resistance regulator